MGTCGLRRLRELKPQRARVCKAGDAGEEATPMVDVKKWPDEQKANTIDFLTRAVAGTACGNQGPPWPKEEGLYLSLRKDAQRPSAWVSSPSEPDQESTARASDALKPSDQVEVCHDNPDPRGTELGVATQSGSRFRMQVPHGSRWPQPPAVPPAAAGR